jgi:hypothetical protein
MAPNMYIIYITGFGGNFENTGKLLLAVGSVKKTTGGNLFLLAITLRKPFIEIYIHWWFTHEVLRQQHVNRTISIGSLR